MRTSTTGTHATLLACHPGRQARAVPLRKIAFARSLYPCCARRTVYTGVPRLTDKTVRLDAFRLQDAEAHLAGEDDELARGFGWFPQRSTLAGVRETIEHWRAQWAIQGPTRCFALRLAGNGVLVGGCELRLQPDGKASMSYWTFPHYRRRGLATRAVQLAAEYAFVRLEVAEIELHVEPDNTASLGVARGAGFIEAGRSQQSPGSDAASRTMLRYVLRRQPTASKTS
jgi:RimJ/RimL family protein N-acetyltransferase